jgi:hypothetical protein
MLDMGIEGSKDLLIGKQIITHIHVSHIGMDQEECRERRSQMSLVSIYMQLILSRHWRISYSSLGFDLHS